MRIEMPLPEIQRCRLKVSEHYNIVCRIREVKKKHSERRIGTPASQIGACVPYRLFAPEVEPGSDWLARESALGFQVTFFLSRVLRVVSSFLMGAIRTIILVLPLSNKP